MRNVKILSFSVFLILIGFFSWFYLIPVYLKELGASDRAVGVLYTLFSFTYYGGQGIGGIIADGIGRKKSIVLPTYLNVPFLLLMGISKNWLIFSLSYLVVNFLSAIQAPAFTALIGESEEERGKAFGYYETLVALGIGLGPLTGALLLKFVGIRTLLLITSFLFLAGAIMRDRFLKETLVRIEGPESLAKFSLKPYLSFLFIGSLVFFIFTLTLNGPFISLFFKEVLGKSKSTINLYFAVGNLVGAIFNPLGGRISDRLGAYKLLLFSIILHTLILTGLPILKSTAFLLLSFPFFHWSYIGIQVLLTEVSSETKRATHIGLFGTISGIVSAPGPFVGMELMIKYGYPAPFLLAFISSLLLFTFYKTFLSPNN